MNTPADNLRAHREMEAEGETFRRDVSDPLREQIMEIARSHAATLRAGFEAQQPEIDRLRKRVAQLEAIEAAARALVQEENLDDWGDCIAVGEPSIVALEKALEIHRNRRSDPDYDPTPWCSGCGAMKKSDCHCRPLAENE